MAQATPEERAMLQDAGYFFEVLSDYMKEQCTRPQTIGYSLAASPVGLAPRIYSMFQDVSGTPGDAEGSFSLDEILDDITLLASEYGNIDRENLLGNGESKMVASRRNCETDHLTGRFSIFAKDHMRKSRRWIDRRYSNVIHFNEPHTA